MSVLSAAPDTVTTQAAQAAEDAAWSAHRAPSGHTYFYNTVTRASTYTMPAPLRAAAAAEAAAAAARASMPVSAQAVPGTSWKEVTCQDGRKYFSNAESNVTTWVPPPEVLQRITPQAPLLRPPPPRPPGMPPPPQGMPQQPPGGVPPAQQRPPVLQVAPQPTNSQSPGQAALAQAPPARLPPEPPHLGAQALAAPLHPRPSSLPMWAGWMGGVRSGMLGPPRPPATPAEDPAVVAKREYRQMLAELDVNEFARFEKFAPKMDDDAR